MQVKLSALLENYDKQTDRRTDRVKFHFQQVQKTDADNAVRDIVKGHDESESRAQ